MVPRTAAVALALLLAVAGCLGAPSPDSDAGTPSTALAETPARTPTATTPAPASTPGTATPVPETTAYATDCPPRLRVEAATESDLERAAEGDVVAYETLSAERRAEFGRALESGDAELDSVPDAWARPRVVTYRGESYATVVSVC